MSEPGNIVFLPKSVGGPPPGPERESTPAAPRALRYDVLSQRHPDCDAKRYEKIEDLYAGGFQIQGKAKRYLAQHLFEHPQRYDDRCAKASYQPYFGMIVDQFVAELFTQPLHVTPAGDAKNPNTPGEFPDEEFYAALAKNFDGRGTELEAIGADLVTTALKHRTAYLLVDAPVEGEEDERGPGIYAYEVSPDRVLDWCEDDQGALLEWVVLYEKTRARRSVVATRSLVREEFVVWSVPSGEGARAEWQRYAIEYEADKPPQAETMVALEDEGTSTFDRVPILRLELPPGLWVGNKIGPQALEHWRRRSELIGAETASCVEIPVAFLGAEMPEPGRMTSESQQNPNRGNDPVGKFEKRGFLVMGREDKFGFFGPEGKAYEIIDKQLEGLREAMYAVNHQMAASIRPTGSALGRSGLSKQKDQESTEKVLGALGRIVRRFAVSLYDVISCARGEDVVWVAHGLDSFDQEDRQQVLEESLALQAVDIPSPTFKKEHAKRVATKLVPNLPPATVAQIADEIDGGIEQQVEIDEIEREAHKDDVLNPKPPVVAPPAAAEQSKAEEPAKKPDAA